jgi:glycosyltransferase involved in cell wall biosynthesis
VRLLYLIHQFLPRHVTGTEQYVRSLARVLRARGHDVRVFSFAPLIQHDAPGEMQFERDETVDGIPVRRVSVHPRASPNPHLLDYHNPAAGRLLARWLERLAADGVRFDVAHVFHARSLGAAAVDEPARRGVPVAVNLMDFWFVCPNFMLLRRGGELCAGPPDGGLGCVPCMDPELGAWVERSGTGPALRALRDRPPALRAGAAASAHALVARAPHLAGVLQRAAAIVAPSRFLRATFEAAGFPAGRIRHVPYGVDLARLGELPPARAAGDLRIGFLGSIAPHKGVHVLIDAVRRLPPAGWRLVVHGDAGTHVGYTGQLRAAAAGEPRIAFAGAFRPGELGAVLGALDVVVVPSLWYENTPFTVLEARAGRRLVVASDLGGIGEALAGAGQTFPAGDAAALAGVLRGLLDDRAPLRAAAQAPLPRTLDDNADEFLVLYRELASRVAPAR